MRGAAGRFSVNSRTTRADCINVLCHVPHVMQVVYMQILISAH